MTLDFESTEIYKNVVLKGQQLAYWLTSSENTILIFYSVVLIFFDEGTLFMRNAKFNRFTLGGKNWQIFSLRNLSHKMDKNSYWNQWPVFQPY